MLRHIRRIGGRVLSLRRQLPLGTFDARIILYCTMIGVVSGLGAVVFLYLLEFVKFLLVEVLAGQEIPSPAGESVLPATLKARAISFADRVLGLSQGFRRIFFFILPSFGGLISGVIVYRFAPEAEGHGTDAYINAFHNLKGHVRPRVPLIKSLASILVLSTCGSGGREGPIAQIGSGFGSLIGKLLKLTDRDRRRMLIAGTAGGLGAIFRAPLGSALTSIEVLYKEDFETDSIIPAIISSVSAYTVFTAICGHQSIFALPYEFSFEQPAELLVYFLMSIMCAVVGIFYIKFFYLAKDRFFAHLPIKKHFKPAIGGLLVGLVGLVCPRALGDGWGYIQEALNGHFALWVFLSLAFFKILSTSFTIGSGGSAGVFGPTLFIGAMVGGAVGSFFGDLFPDLIRQPEAFVLVGMASFFAGVANAPVASLIMVCEMTGGYGLVAPLMLVGAFNIIFMKKYSIYEKQVGSKFDSPAHLGEMRVNILKEITVSSIIKDDKAISVSPETTLGGLNNLVKQSRQVFFPVVEPASRKHVGTVSLNDIREVMFEKDAELILIAEDIMTDPQQVTGDMDLHQALSLLVRTGHDEIPVVNQDGAITGMLNHGDIVSAYDDAIKETR